MLQAYSSFYDFSVLDSCLCCSHYFNATEHCSIYSNQLGVKPKSVHISLKLTYFHSYIIAGSFRVRLFK